MEEQLELDFTSECPEEARELGIRWAPRNATPEETNNGQKQKINGGVIELCISLQQHL